MLLTRVAVALRGNTIKRLHFVFDSGQCLIFNQFDNLCIRLQKLFGVLAGGFGQLCAA